MNRKTMITLGIIAFFVGVVAVSAYQQYTLTNTAKIEGLGSIIEIKGEGSEVWVILKETDTILWDVVVPGEDYVYDVRITNVGTIIFLVTFTTEVDTKYGWTEVLSIADQTVDLDTSLVGTLTLSVPIEATPNDYEWTSNIECIEVPS